MWLHTEDYTPTTLCTDVHLKSFVEDSKIDISTLLFVHHAFPYSFIEKLYWQLFLKKAGIYKLLKILLV